MRSDIRRYSILLLPTLIAVTFLYACGSPKKKEPATSSTFIKQKAIVIDVDETLGTCTLQTDKQRINAFWTSDYDTAPMANGDGVILKPDVNNNYRETVSHRVAFPAKPGDEILFSGLKVNNDVWLRWVYPLPKKK